MPQMPPALIEAENSFNNLLPTARSGGGPGGGLMAVANEWSALVWERAVKAGPAQLGNNDISQGLRLAKNSVFICGVHRSGTTLLRDMLDGHPQLVVLPSEGTFYTNIESKLQALPQNEWVGYLTREWLRRLANPINQAPYWLLGRSTVATSPYIDFARYVLAWWDVVEHKPGTQWPHMAVVLAYASCTGNLAATAWVDKTPVNERFIYRIRHEMPSAKIIQMVREPLATLASHKIMAPGSSLRQPLRNLNNSFIIAAQQVTFIDPDFLLLRYEHLCDDPQYVISTIASFLNIEPSPVLSVPTVAQMPTRANSSFNRTAQAGQILKPAEHRQQSNLKKSEQQVAAAYLYKAASVLNYPLPKVGILRNIFLRLKYRLF